MFYCPFARPDGEHLASRWRQEPEGAALALEMERRSLALNPRGRLFAKESALQFAIDNELTEALALSEHRIRTGPWAIYDVRRIYFAKKDPDNPNRSIPTKKGHAYRSVQTLYEGGREQLLDRFEGIAASEQVSLIHDPSGVGWAHLKIPSTDRYPTVQQLYALGPAGISDKERKAFAGAWSALVDQTQLFAA